MNSLIFLLCLISTFCFATVDREGDLQKPVSDISEIQRQEERLPPTIEEVEIKQRDDAKTVENYQRKARSKKSPKKNQQY